MWMPVEADTKGAVSRMNKTDWYNCGARIGDLVQSAIERNDFKQLNEAITDTINATVDAVQESIVHTNAQKKSGRYANGAYRVNGNAYDEAKAKAEVSDIFESIRRSAVGERQKQSSSDNKSLRGVFSMVAGYGMAILSGLAALFMLFLNWLTGISLFGISVWFFLILAAVFAVVGAKGGGYRSRMKQLERYMKIMDGRDVVTLEELASGTGKSVKEVSKDLKAMIQDGMFASEAYLDPQNTTLMTSRKAYQQYVDTMKAYEQRKAQRLKEERTGKTKKEQEQTRQKAEKDLQGYSGEIRQILQDGRDFISHIHECNEKIPGKEMTDKLDTLEQVVTRIFEQVAKEPDSAPDLHRMMSYYLPTTRKLVDAYVELGASSLGGANIQKTRTEIERSLDTVNQAFETFLDSFYEDTAWDISSDISAMTTMMARDGLTGGDFSRVRKVGQDINKANEQAASAVGSDSVTLESAQTFAGAAAGLAAASGSAGAAAAAVMEEEQ